MSRYVIDASTATEYLLRTPLGLKLVDILEDAMLLAPELLDVEVMSVLRRAVLRGELSDQRAALALDDLTDWGVDRIPTCDCSDLHGNIETMSVPTTLFM